MRTQVPAFGAVPRGVSPFAQLLEAAIAQPEPRLRAPFEETLRAFERGLGAPPAICPVVSSPAAVHWAAELGVELPCTAADLKRAFRRLALETHPDRPGGSHEAFLRTQRLFREALDDTRAGIGPKNGLRAYTRHCARGASALRVPSTYA